MSEQKTYFQTIGTMTPGKKSDSFTIKIISPLMLEQKFFVSPNTVNESENAPSHSIWMEGIKVGSLWKRVSREHGKVFYSGSIFSLLSADYSLKFSVFKVDSENGENDSWEVKIPLVKKSQEADK